MDNLSNTVPEPPGGPATSARPATSATPGMSPLRWSVRRELWENRSVYVAPLAVAGVVMVGSLIAQIGLPATVRTLPALAPAARHAAVVRPYAMVPVPLVLVMLLVGIFYSLDALYGERRDRSLLFWKSLPVSDRTTVLAKASIPLAVLPLLTCALSLAVQCILLLLSSAHLLAHGESAAPLWGELPLLQMPLVLLYSLATLALWHAPLYGWLLLVSAWARRSPVLWAALPPLALCVIERMAFHSSHFASLLRYRLLGGIQAAFASELQRGAVIDRLAQLDPAKFLSTPGLWSGLVAAAAFLAGAVRLRRYRQPI